MDRCAVAVNRQGNLSAMVLIPGLVSRQDKVSASSEHLGPLELYSKRHFSAHAFSSLAFYPQILYFSPYKWVVSKLPNVRLWPTTAINVSEFHAQTMTAFWLGPEPASMDVPLAAVDPRHSFVAFWNRVLESHFGFRKHTIPAGIYEYRFTIVTREK
jgi:hypothetical protein